MTRKTTTTSCPPIRRRLHAIALLVFLLLACAVDARERNITPAGAAAGSAATSLAPVTSLIAEDFNYDDGERLRLTWVPSIDDQPGIGTVTGYDLYRIVNGGAPTQITSLRSGTTTYLDRELYSDSSYQYYIVTRSRDASAESIHTAAMFPETEWINLGLLNLFIAALVCGGAVLLFIQTAKSGRKLFVRKIAGLGAIDEAIGRATEMGRPILFIPGIDDMNEVQTLAALTILGHVAEHVAEYDTKIRMPVSRSLVMTAGREIIKAGYQTAGRPDAYSDDMVNYVTDEQFGYVAAVDGIMVRERPATVFLLGSFFAESLILAETGNSVGAIQIAGTARPAQLPFFIAACDFTLIGEELFAASAYLSGEPKALGSLKGQDIGKAIAMAAIVIGVGLATAVQFTGEGTLTTWLHWWTAIFQTQ